MNNFVDKILKKACQGDLFSFFQDDPTLINSPFYDLLSIIQETQPNSILAKQAQLVYQTEQILSPLNRIFRYLQTQSYWKKETIENDAFISNCRTLPLIKKEHKKTIDLANLYDLNNWELVQGLIKRNKAVTHKRHSAPWMTQNEKAIEVNHFEGSFLNLKYNPLLDNDHNYFLNSFCSLYKQLH